MSTGTAAPIVIVRAQGSTAVYRHDDSAWVRVVNETGNAEGLIYGMRLAEANIVDEIADGTHLLVRGEFPEELDTFDQPTAVAVLRGEIGALRKEARRLSEAAAYSGEMGSGGAARLITRAEALEHAIEVFTQHP